MANRYGGGSEDFEKEAAEAKGLARARAEADRKLQLYDERLSKTATSEEKATGAARARAAAQREADALSREVARGETQTTKAIQEQTIAARENEAAMQRRLATLKQQPVSMSRALRGAQDPAFAEAYGLGPTASQRSYRQFGAGYERTRNIQQAVQGGFRPPTGAGQFGPMERGASDVEGASTARLARQRELYASVAQSQALYGRNLSLSSNAARQAAVGYGVLDNSMMRHGALSSEYILATARGETTLRDLGQQAVVTAGKFGAWTLAATALFGAAAAIHQMGTGAIQASSGVNTLKRVIDNVDSGKAQQSFSDLSKQFNVPIATSVDAVYRMGQVFHNQAQATEAAKAALYSYKTGEVDVATSTKNLIAITNGFHLSSHQLLTVYDQINQAQNRFGISIGDTEAGLAKAGGTYRNAGGHLNYLLGIFVAIQKATGRSGQEIGTGIARAVNRIRTPISQQQLRAQGVEVDPGNFEKTLQSALRASQRPGADKQQIAAGLFGNQYARLIAPVLTDQKLLNQALKDTSPEASKNSAQKELAHVLKETQEQIHAVGNGLQRLGASLARTGTLTPLGGLLQLLNGALTVTTDLVNVFNRLPGPVKQTVSLLGEGYLLLKLMQKVGATERFAGGPLGGLANTDRQFQVRGLKAQRVYSESIADEARNAAQRQASTGTRLTFAQRRAETTTGAFYEDVNKGNLVKGTAAYDARILAVKADTERVNALTAAYTEEQALTQEYNAEARIANEELIRQKGLNARQYRQQFGGGHVPVERTSPSYKGTQYVPPGGGAERYDYGARGVTGARAASAEERNLTAAAAAWEQRMVAKTGGLSASENAVTRAAGRVSEKGAGIVTRGASGATRAGSSLARLATSLPAATGAILGALGPLDGILLGLVAGGLIAEHINKVTEHLQSLDNTANQIADTQAKVRQAKEASDSLAGPSSIRAPSQNTFGAGLADSIKNRLTGRQGFIDASKTDEATREVEKAATDAARKAGRPLPNLTREQIAKRMDDAARSAKAGLTGLAEFNRNMKDRLTEVQNTAHLSPEDAAALKDKAGKLSRSVATQLDPANFKQRFAGLSTTDLEGFQKVTGDRLNAPGTQPTQFDLKESAAEYHYLAQKLQGTNDPKKLQEWNQARDTYFQGLETLSQRDVDEGLLTSTNQGERQNAFSKAATVLRRMTAQPAAELRKAKQERDAAKAQKDADLNSIQHGAKDVNIGADNARLRTAQKNVSDREKEYAQALGRQKIDLDKLRDSAYQDRQNNRQILQGLAASRTADPGQQAAVAVRYAAAQVRDAARTYGTHRNEYFQAVTAYNQARQQQAAALVQSVQADTSLAVARAGSDPVAQARATLQGATNVLRTQQARPNLYSTVDLKNSQAAVIQARTALAQSIRDQANQLAQLQSQLIQARTGDPVAAARAAQNAARQELHTATNKLERLQALVDLANANDQVEKAIVQKEQARTDLLKSRTQDPVQQALLDYREASFEVGHTRGTDHTQALTKRNTTLQGYRQAKAQGREDDVDFELTMGKITNDEAIRRLEGILHARGLSKQFRRQIEEKIHGLQGAGAGEASGFDLDVGALKLPTVYDVRKAWDPIRQQVKSQATERLHNANQARRAADPGDRQGIGTAVQAVNYDNKVYVIVNSGKDVAAVYDALDRVLHTGVRSKMRSRGHARRR